MSEPKLLWRLEAEIVKLKCLWLGDDVQASPRNSSPGLGKSHRGIRVVNLKPLLRYRKCNSKKVSIEPVARTRRQGSIGGTI